MRLSTWLNTSGRSSHTLVLLRWVTSTSDIWWLRIHPHSHWSIIITSLLHASLVHLRVMLSWESASTSWHSKTTCSHERRRHAWLWVCSISWLLRWTSWHSTIRILILHVLMLHGWLSMMTISTHWSGLVDSTMLLLLLLAAIVILLVSSTTSAIAIVVLLLVALTGIVHFNIPWEKLLPLHFLHGAFALLFGRKLNKPVSFRSSGNGVTNDFGFVDWRIVLFEKLQQHWVSHRGIEVTHIHLMVSTLLLVSTSTSTSTVLSAHVIVSHSTAKRCSLTCSSSPLVIGVSWSGNTTTVRSPVEFEHLIAAIWNRLAIERVEYFPRSLRVLKLDKAIPHGRSFDFVSD